MNPEANSGPVAPGMFRRAVLSCVLIVLCITMMLPGCGSSGGGGIPPEVVAILVGEEPVGRYVSVGNFLEGAMEIISWDPVTGRIFATNTDDNTIEVIDLNLGVTNPTLIDDFDLDEYGDGLTSCAVKNGVLAVAVVAEDWEDNGVIALFNAATLEEIAVYEISGPLPDMVGFSPNGRFLCSCNEGEPDGDVDPEGSITVIDFGGPVSVANADSADVSHADFNAFDGQAAALRAAGVRLWPDVPGEVSVSQDLEPEYLAYTPDSMRAFVTLQENNAVAVVNLATATVTDILPLGYKDHSIPGNGLDVSNDDGGINIRTWPICSLYMPDGIAIYEVDGEIYFVTANEGDDRGDLGDDRGDVIEVGDMDLDQAAFEEDIDELQENENLGGLKASGIDGFDGENYTKIVAYGGRSFSIWDEDGNQVFDSGDDFEQIIAARFPERFNSDFDYDDGEIVDNGVDERSDNSGPEPESVVVAMINERWIAFVGLEKMGGVMVYDVTNPAHAKFIDYINMRDFDGENDPTDVAGENGVPDAWEDLNFNDIPDGAELSNIAPEGLLVIPAAQSPTGTDLVVISCEDSGTVVLYEILPNH